MKKKAILAIFFLTIIISCGKKGDPEYKAFKNINSLIQVV